MANEQTCESEYAGVLCENEDGGPPKTQGVENKAKRGDLATTSLVLAVVSWPLTLLCATGILSALVAIVLGHVAIHGAKHGPSSTGARSRAIKGLIVSYVYIGIAALLVGKIVINRVSTTTFTDDTGMSFTMHTPLKGTSYEWHIKDRDVFWIVMAPKPVELSTRFNVASPVVPANLRDFEFLTISFFRNRRGGTVIDVARNLIAGTQVWDKTYSATDPEPLAISDTTSAFFQESVLINGTPVRGIVFLVPANDGYYALTFRADPDTYTQSLYQRIAGTFRPIGTSARLLIE